jgi:SAM-dependent methyltransferase
MWLFRGRQRSVAVASWERTPPPVSLDEDGRRHRTDVPYLLPKDEQEIQRLDYQHFVFRHLLQGNIFAPVDPLLRKGGNVLDVGCGTGRWGQEIATSYPKTQVIGFDLENVPRTASTPLNYQFHRGNLLSGFPFPAHTFHYVHQRALVVGIPLERWPFVVGELRRVTQAGRWVELVEMGTTFHHAGPATTQFLQWWAAISQTRGIDASHVSQMGDLLERSGFSAVKAKTERIPVGMWGGRIGNLLAQDILAGWPTMRPYAHTLLQVAPERFQEVIGRLETEWNALQTCYEVYFACGQV